MTLAFDSPSETMAMPCTECGGEYQMKRSMLARDGQLWAVVYTSMHNHGRPLLTFDAVFGTWGAPEPNDHTTLGARLTWPDGASEPAGEYKNAVEPFADAPVWGYRVSAAEAANHPLRNDLWSVVEFILDHEPDVYRHLYGTGPAASAKEAPAIEPEVVPPPTAVIVAPTTTTGTPAEPRAEEPTGPTVTESATDEAEAVAAWEDEGGSTSESPAGGVVAAEGTPGAGTPIELDFGDDIDLTDDPDKPALSPNQVGQPSYLELGVPDAKAAVAFYAELLDWNYQNNEVRTNTLPIGIHGDDQSAHFEPFFDVADLESALVRLITLGGTQLAPVQDSGSFGLWVECADNQGVRFALRQPQR